MGLSVTSADGRTRSGDGGHGLSARSGERAVCHEGRELGLVSAVAPVPGTNYVATVFPHPDRGPETRFVVGVFASPDIAAEAIADWHEVDLG